MEAEKYTIKGYEEKETGLRITENEHWILTNSAIIPAYDSAFTTKELHSSLIISNLLDC